MLAGSRDITPGSVARLRGVSVVGAHNIRSGITHIPHLLPVKVTGDKDSSSSSTTRTGVGKQPTLANKAKHLNRIKLDHLTSRCEIIEVEFT